MNTRTLFPRSRVASCLLALPVLTFGCGGGGSGAGASSNEVQVADTRSDGSKLSADDKAAADFIRSMLEEHWVKTPDGWTNQWQLKNVFGEVMPGEPDILYKQYRDLKFSVKPDELSESMRLNGTDYRGIAEFSQTSVRYFRTRETFEGPQGWSSWQDGDLLFRTIAIERRNGKWIHEGDDLFDGLKPDPAEVASAADPMGL